VLRKGRPLTVEKHERTGSTEPAGVRATACRHRRPDATREAPSSGRGHGSTGNSRETGQAVWGGGEARSTDEAE
jgi:hypothetical protein